MERRAGVFAFTREGPPEPVQHDHQLIAWLETRLLHPLPGPEAQRRFEPEGAAGRHFETVDHARQAAVMILLYPHNDRWHVPLTVRPDHLPDHPGQISLPGGALEADEDTAQAALRELQEEIGVSPAEVRVLGAISPLYVFASNFFVTPWVGLAERRPAFAVDPVEVETLLEVPLGHLLDPGNHTQRPIEIGGRPYQVPCFDWQGHTIWGATSMILSELVHLLEEYDRRDSM